eukprot:gene37299-48767_t
MSNFGAGDLVFSSSPHLGSTVHVLVIEAKYLDFSQTGSTARTKKTKHRKKVWGQVYSSMDTWKRNHQNHTVYGAILINEEVSRLGSNLIADGVYLSNMISSIGQDIPLQFPLDDIGESSPPELCFYPPLPRAMWGTEYKPFIDLGLWNEIKKERFAHERNTCEMCKTISARPEEDQVLHQRWEYITDDGEEDTNEMSVHFYRFDVLCLKCHDLMHVSRAASEGRGIPTLTHFQEKANKTLSEAKAQLILAKAEWVMLNERKVVEVDHSRIFSYKAVIDWLKVDERRCVGRFGNFCCFQHFNPQLPKQR